jgi:hypothetical protein
MRVFVPVVMAVVLMPGRALMGVWHGYLFECCGYLNTCSYYRVKSLHS